MKQPEKIPMPRLAQEVKDMNGKSTKKLTQCLDLLNELLDDDEQINTCPHGDTDIEQLHRRQRDD